MLHDGSKEVALLAKMPPHACVVTLLGHGPRLAVYAWHGRNLDRELGAAFFAEPQAMAVTHQLLQALQHCHAHGVVHCDLTPYNILVSAGQVKLADFGNGHAAGRAMPWDQTTVNWRAPEVALRRPGCGAAVDLWAAGLVLAEMATGSRPWSLDDKDDLQNVHLVAAALAYLKKAPLLPCQYSERAHTLASGLLAGRPEDRLTAREALGLF